MTRPTTASPTRGEVWRIRFDPVTGAEIAKTRPALVVNLPSIGKLPLRIVVPLTDWKAKYETVPWIVRLKPTARNGLAKESGADCFQVKSISTERFAERLGAVTMDEIEEVSAAIALCVGA